MRFLVVEDNDLAARALGRLLEPHGQVVRAATVREALSLVEPSQGAWRAFFFDLLLPDGSGLDVLAHARVYHPRTPTMILSGCLEKDAVNAAYDMDAVYVMKPLLTSRIARFLPRSDFGARLAAATSAWRQRYGLSEGEADVLRRAAAGESRAVMAGARKCSLLTIKTHASRLLTKCDDDSLLEAAARLLREAAGAIEND